MSPVEVKNLKKKRIFKLFFNLKIQTPIIDFMNLKKNQYNYSKECILFYISLTTKNRYFGENVCIANLLMLLLRIRHTYMFGYNEILIEISNSIVS